MESYYYLGANTAEGFSSLYGGFCRGRGELLRIVKGGPGTGKSGFMRAVGREAARRGLDVEYVLCSGDPDSIDGVYIPALALGYCDGTAPHAAEPGVFGADGDYADVGQFCRTPLPESAAKRAVELSREYRGKYGRAYALLAAAQSVERALSPAGPCDRAIDRAETLMSSLIERLPAASGTPPRFAQRYLGAISCRGVLSEISSLAACRLIFECEDGCGLGAVALKSVEKAAFSRSFSFVECPSPAGGAVPDAVVVPELSAAFLRGTGRVDGAERIRLDRLCGELDEVKARRRALRAARREGARYIELACAVLAEAKRLHDELEGVYRPHMDFPALDAYTAREIARVFA